MNEDTEKYREDFEYSYYKSVATCKHLIEKNAQEIKSDNNSSWNNLYRKILT